MYYVEYRRIYDLRATMLMHCHEIAIFKQRAILVPERQNHYNNKHNERIYLKKKKPKKQE